MYFFVQWFDPIVLRHRNQPVSLRHFLLTKHSEREKKQRSTEEEEEKTNLSFDVSMNDFIRMEMIQSVENLFGDQSNPLFF